MAPAVDINYLAVLVAAVAAMAIGAFWYSPIGFGKQWMKLSEMTEKKIEDEKKKGMGKTYAVAFAGTLVMSFVLAYFVDYTQAMTIAEGIQAGFWLWLGFIATVQLGIVLWEGKPIKLYLINSAHYLTTLVVMGAILAVWA